MNSQWPESFIQREHLVHGHEAGLAGNLKFVNCLHYLQDAAETNADALGVGLEFLKGCGLMWVLSRYHIRLDHYPFVGDRIRVVTWPYGWKRLFAIREFVFIDSNGARYGNATSAWLLIRAEDHRPVRPQDHLPPVKLFPQREIENDFTRLPALGRVDYQERFKVRMHDLDINRHVNNSIYVEWALETVPVEVWKQFRPHEVEVEFLSMAFLGEKVGVEVEQVKEGPHPVFLHRIFRDGGDGQELTACAVVGVHWIAILELLQ